MADNFDDKSDKNTTTAYPTMEEIQNIKLFKVNFTINSR